MDEFLIHSPLRHYAETTPAHPALSLQGAEMSYQDLELRSNQLAHALIAAGVRPKDRVGLFLHKSLELGVAIYATLKTGAVFVPLDPFMPAERLAFILEDCGIEVLITSDLQCKVLEDLRKKDGLTLAGVTKPVPFKTITQQMIAAHPLTVPDVIITDQYLGYIMYTSGSTGEPKGMMHTHAGSIAYANWGKDHVKLTAADRVASHAPLHFDLSIFDFFSTLRAGGTVVLVPEALTKFPASWTKLIQEQRITAVFTVPYTLISMVEQGAMKTRDLSSLRWIMFGGEPYPPKQLRVIMEALPQVQFTNVYGPAEAPSCTCYDIPRPLPEGDAPLPIGLVSRNSEGLIIDEDDVPCAPTAPGELCIKSSTLTRGYWNKPDLNKKAFLLRKGYGPFPDVYFRTGDRVQEGEDGNLRFLGRMDRMVKTRGNRVELDEVEAALVSHTDVIEVAAFVVPDAHASWSIIATVTLREGSDADRGSLTKHMRAKLPPYAVPRDILILSELPHGSSGKVDRRLLRQTYLKEQTIWSEKDNKENQ